HLDHLINQEIHHFRPQFLVQDISFSFNIHSAHNLSCSFLIGKVPYQAFTKGLFEDSFCCLQLFVKLEPSLFLPVVDLQCHNGLLPVNIKTQIQTLDSCVVKDPVLLPSLLSGKTSCSVV